MPHHHPVTYVCPPFTPPSNDSWFVNGSVDHHSACPQANIASFTPIVENDASWFPDSGATNHLTNAYPSPHHTCVPCTGQAKLVVVMDGSSLNIYVIGSTIIPFVSRYLHLHNMIYTSCVIKIYICVSIRQG